MLLTNVHLRICNSVNLDKCSGNGSSPLWDVVRTFCRLQYCGLPRGGTRQEVERVLKEEVIELIQF